MDFPVGIPPLKSIRRGPLQIVHSMGISLLPGKLLIKLPGKLSGIDFPFEKPYLLTRASPQDDARNKANSLKFIRQQSTTNIFTLAKQT